MKISLSLLMGLGWSIALYAQSQSDHQNDLVQANFRYEDKIRIRETMKISDYVGDQVWEGMARTPFTILFLTDSLEFLLNHPHPSKDFQRLPYDSLLASEVYYRPRVFDKSFLATFPAVEGVNCILVGTPENTGKNTSDWIITLIHEHFHQYQNAQDGYYKKVNELGLAGDDQSGMWMLDYAFPYDDPKVNAQYEDLVKKLLEAIDADSDREALAKMYFQSKSSLRNLIKKDDYKYLSFQLWQEGIARYTEFKYLELLKNYPVSPEVQALADFIPFSKFKQEFLSNQRQSFEKLTLREHKRICFYAWGLAEGLLFDQVNPNWRKNYHQSNFFLEN